MCPCPSGAASTAQPEHTDGSVVSGGGALSRSGWGAVARAGEGRGGGGGRKGSVFFSGSSFRPPGRGQAPPLLWVCAYGGRRRTLTGPTTSEVSDRLDGANTALSSGSRSC